MDYTDLMRTTFRQQLQHAFLSQRSLNTVLFVVSLLFVNVFGVILLLGVFEVGKLNAIYKTVAYNTTECTTESTNSTRTFLIYDFYSVGASGLAQRLCADPALKKEFRGVRVRWQHESIENIRAIMDQYDLIVSNDLLMESGNLGELRLFEPIASYQNYTSVFLSHELIENISFDSFKDKRIGLLDKRTSQSGYLIAREVIEKNGINASDLNIVYFSNHREARQALLRYEVDIIASYWNPEKDSKMFQSVYVKELKSASGYNWYLRREWLGNMIECAIHDALKAYVRASSDSYFSNLRFHRECNNQ